EREQVSEDDLLHDPQHLCGRTRIVRTSLVSPANDVRGHERGALSVGAALPAIPAVIERAELGMAALLARARGRHDVASAQPPVEQHPVAEIAERHGIQALAELVPSFDYKLRIHLPRPKKVKPEQPRPGSL